MFSNVRLKNFIAEQANEDAATLALKFRGKVDFDLGFAIDQIEGRKKARTKLPLFYSTENYCYPPSISMEQCSSEATAKYKQSICSGKGLFDVCGGLGIDTFFMSRSFQTVDYSESNEKLKQIAEYNFDLLNAKNIYCHLGDGVQILKDKTEKYDWLYADPSRRSDKKGKVFFIEDCQPNVIEELEFFKAKANRILIKLSPLLDLKHIVDSLPGVERIHIVSVKNECKELLVEIGAGSKSDVGLVCVNITDENTERFEELWSARSQIIESTAPLNFIYEANRSIMKAGLQNQLAKGLDLKKLAPQSHFFSSDHFLEWFPGRIFKFVKLVASDLKAIKEELTDQKANVIARNYPLKASEIYKKYKIVPGGDDYILASTLKNGSKVLILAKRVK